MECEVEYGLLYRIQQALCDQPQDQVGRLKNHHLGFRMIISEAMMAKNSGGGSVIFTIVVPYTQTFPPKKTKLMAGQPGPPCKVPLIIRL